MQTKCSVGAEGIRFNAIAPGVVNTPMPFTKKFLLRIGSGAIPKPFTEYLPEDFRTATETNKWLVA